MMRSNIDSSAEDEFSREDLGKLHSKVHYLSEAVDLWSENEIRFFLPDEVVGMSYRKRSIAFAMVKAVQLTKELDWYSQRRIDDALMEIFLPEIFQPRVFADWRLAPGSKKRSDCKKGN